MRRGFFYYLGKVLYHLRYVIVLLMIIGVGLCIPLVPKAVSTFSKTGFVDPVSESAIADKFLEKNLNYQQNRFIVLYQSDKSFTRNPALFTDIKNSLARIKSLPFKTEIIYPSDNKKQVSKDKKTAYAVVLLKNNKELSDEEVKQIRAAIKKPPLLNMLVGGRPVFIGDTKKQTQTDLIRAEYIATPVAVITLLIVFGSVIAALVPMVLDGVCAVFILTLLYFLGRYLSLSVFTLNIALLLGLCLSLDYALFIISRFREEMRAHNNVIEALGITLATAGKAVFFSGLAVLISLSALLFFPINVLFSVGVGGMIAVGVAVLVSVVLLPAMLGILKHRINWLSIPILRNDGGDSKFWQWWVEKVVRRPWLYFISILAFLIVLGIPFLSVELGISDYRILPKNLESRQVFDLFEKKFSGTQLTPISVLVKTHDGDMLTKNNISRLYQFASKVDRESAVDRIDSIVTTDPRLSKAEYQMLYTIGQSRQSKSLKQYLNLTTKKDFSVLTVVSKYPNDDDHTKKLVERLRDMSASGLKVQVTGVPANTMDVLNKIKAIFPYAFWWIIGLTYLILLILLRSLFLPVKAILVNMLSLFASYGVLVFIVQQGHLARLLNFEAQGLIDISLLIIIFCALFGFSMDYEVFLLSRIKERYEQTADSIKSICYGIVHSSRIITSAAVIVILICFSFISANILLVKAFGLGIAIAIFIDAFLIRTVLVPALMAILGKWNWYLPKWLNVLLPRLSFNPKDKHN